MITDIEDFFSKGCGRCDRFATPECSTRLWSDGLADLRRICLDLRLVEAVKWGHPCYEHAGRNIALIGSLRGDFRLNFFNAALMKDPKAVLERQGPNTRHPDMIRFTHNTQVRGMEPIIRSYLKEAMGYAAAGIKAPKAQGELELPAELTDALGADQELADGFYRLTPGRQRSYVINLNSAKRPETRLQRISKFRLHILQGKGANER